LAQAAETAPATSPAPTTTTTGTGTPSGAGGPPPANPGLDMLVMFVPMILIFYFLFIRPESKRRKEKEAVMAGLKKNDKVVTIGGLHGTVVEVEGEEVVLLVDAKKDVKLRFRRTAVDIVEAAK
jgi:preprotein translocase subunit YajC